MKLGINSDASNGKQKYLVIGLIAVIVIVGGWFAYSSFFAGNGGGDQTVSQPTPPVGGPTPGTPGVNPPAPATAPGSPKAPGAKPRPAAAAKPTPVKPAAPPVPLKTITVFGTVTAGYPSGWGIDLKSASSAAVLTNGKGRFEIHPPDPKANNAKAIADSALSAYAKGAKIVSQGPVKIANFDAYQYTVNGGQIKIIGVDSSTRVAIVERVQGGQMAAYRAIFDRMESALQFK